MPDRRTHELFCQLLLGKKYTQVHKLMDMPSRWMGIKHRRLFHDTLGACLASALTGDPKAFLAAQLHIMLDEKRISPNLVKLAYKHSRAKHNKINLLKLCKINSNST